MNSLFRSIGYALCGTCEYATPFPSREFEIMHANKEADWPRSRICKYQTSEVQSDNREDMYSTCQNN
jgi:hypothetical protein